MKKYMFGVFSALSLITGFSLHASLQELPKEASFEQLIKAEKVVVVYYYHNRCKYCRNVSGVIPAVSEKLPNVRFVKVNTDLHPNAVKAKRAADVITTVPHVRFYKDGEIVHKIDDSSGITENNVYEAAKKLQ